MRMQCLELLQLCWENEETQHAENDIVERQKEPSVWCHSDTELAYFGIYLSWDILFYKFWDFQKIIIEATFIWDLSFLKTFQYRLR